MLLSSHLRMTIMPEAIKIIEVRYIIASMDSIMCRFHSISPQWGKYKFPECGHLTGT